MFEVPTEAEVDVMEDCMSAGGGLGSWGGGGGGEGVRFQCYIFENLNLTIDYIVKKIVFEGFFLF